VTWAELVAYALAKPGAWADEPWEGDQVVKVGSKIFLFCGSGEGAAPGVSLRCQPDDVEAWRDRYPEAIGPAPYMGKRPWNRVLIDGTVADDDLLTLVDDSYDSVVARLVRRERPEGWRPPAPVQR
jgi:predicted DNA-binding protein (MmcQ/YjbR family)